ncbi:hypothetical protein T439DRAFT_320505 [Meredithblackwellia eburnea MCA 4105]
MQDEPYPVHRPPSNLYGSYQPPPLTIDTHHPLPLPPSQFSAETPEKHAASIPIAETPVRRKPPRVDLHRQSRTPAYALILAPLVLATLVAVGHHLFNSSLDGTAVNNLHNEALRGQEHEWKWKNGQASALLVGNVLAQLAKVFLSLAVGIAFVQRTWLTVSRERMTIQAVDNLFGVTTSPLAFLSLEMWTAGWIAAFIAAVWWSLVAVTVFPVPSLTTAQVLITAPGSFEVQTFDQTVKLWQTTDTGQQFYGGPTVPIQRIALSTFVSGLVATPISPCGNCTYSQQIYAPTLTCSEGLPSGLVPTETNGPLVEYGFATRNWAATSFTASSNGTAVVPSFGLGNSIAIQYMDIDGTRNIQNITCDTKNASYAISTDFSKQPGASTITSIDVVDWNPATSNDSFSRINGGQSVPDVIERLNFDAIRDALFVRLNGTFLIQISGIDPVGIPASSSLFNGTVWVDEMPRALEQAFANITLSLLTTNLALKNPSTRP